MIAKDRAYLFKVDEEPTIKPATEFRVDMGINAPEPGQSFLIVRRNVPKLLLVPTRVIVAFPLRDRVLQLIVRAMNKVPALRLQEYATDVYHVSLSDLRKNITSFFRRIDLSPYPGWITSYGQIVGFYIPVRSYEDASAFLRAYNQEIGNEERRA